MHTGSASDFLQSMLSPSDYIFMLYFFTSISNITTYSVFKDVQHQKQMHTLQKWQYGKHNTETM